VYKIKAFEKLLGYTFGYLNNVIINLPNNEIDLAPSFDNTNRNHFLLNISLPNSLNDFFIEPATIFKPILNPYFTINEINLIVNEKNILHLLQNIIDNPDLKKQYRHYILLIFIAIIACICYYIYNSQIPFESNFLTKLKNYLSKFSLIKYYINREYLIYAIYFITPIFIILLVIITSNNISIKLAIIFSIILLFYSIYSKIFRFYYHNKFYSCKTNTVQNLFTLSTLFTILSLLLILLPFEFEFYGHLIFFISFILSFFIILFSRLINKIIKRDGLFKIFLVLLFIIILIGSVKNSQGWYTVIFCLECLFLLIFIKTSEYKFLYTLTVIIWSVACFFFYLGLNYLSGIFSVTVLSLLTSIVISYFSKSYFTNKVLHQR